MLKDNIKSLRKQKGLSQEELSIKLNVVRQTISKWEQGLSVPDSEMLISISKVFDTSVSTLLGESIDTINNDDIETISSKLEVINSQLAKDRENKRKFWHWFFISICIILVIIFVLLLTIGNKYMDWNYNDPEYAILGVGIHSFIWIFIRLLPFLFIGSIVGICFTTKR